MTTIDRPNKGYIELFKEEYKIENEINNKQTLMTPTEFLSLTNFIDENPIDNIDRQQLQPLETTVAKNTVIQRIQNINSMFMRSLFASPNQRVLLNEFARFQSLTDSALGTLFVKKNGEIINTSTIESDYYNKVHIAKTMTHWQKIINYDSIQHAANVSTNINILSFRARNLVTRTMPRYHLTLTGYQKSLRSLTMNIARWPLLPILLDLSNIPTEYTSQRLYIEANIDIFRTLYICLSIPYFDTFKMELNTNALKVYTLGQSSKTSIRTGFDIQRLTYDYQRWKFYVKFLQLLFDVTGDEEPAAPFVSNITKNINDKLIDSLKDMIKLGNIYTTNNNELTYESDSTIDLISDTMLGLLSDTNVMPTANDIRANTKELNALKRLNDFATRAYQCFCDYDFDGIANILKQVELSLISDEVIQMNNLQSYNGSDELTLGKLLEEF